MTWLALAAKRATEWVGCLGWVFLFTSGGSFTGLEHTPLTSSFCVWRDWDWTDGLDMVSHDYQACQADRWVIWLVLSLLNCCQQGKSGENKSMAPSSRPSMYLSVIKISNILWQLLGDFSGRKSPSHTGDSCNKWSCHVSERILFFFFGQGPNVGTEWTVAGLQGVLFIQSQMLCVLGHWVQNLW
jgi:hypothetical protein